MDMRKKIKDIKADGLIFIEVKEDDGYSNYTLYQPKTQKIFAYTYLTIIKTSTLKYSTD